MRTTQLEVRPATLSDAALLADLGARTFRDAFGAQNDPVQLALHLATQFNPDRQRQELGQPDWITLLALVDGAPVGYAQSLSAEPPVELPGGAARFLRRLYLEQAWTGRGIGRPLLEAMVADARNRGAAWLWLTTWEQAPQAIGFYRKSGFEEVGTTTFRLGDQPQRDLVFARRL